MRGQGAGFGCGSARLYAGIAIAIIGEEQLTGLELSGFALSRQEPPCCLREVSELTCVGGRKRSRANTGAAVALLTGHRRVALGAAEIAPAVRWVDPQLAGLVAGGGLTTLAGGLYALSAIRLSR